MNCESVTMSLFINHLTIPRSLYFEKKIKNCEQNLPGMALAAVGGEQKRCDLQWKFVVAAVGCHNGLLRYVDPNLNPPFGHE